MDALTSTFVIIVALMHVWFCALETYFWQKPLGLKTFRIDPEFAKQSAPLMANQGVYNLFLSAGLLWSLCANNPDEAFHLKVFFLGCVVVAGIFGGISVNKRIFLIQGVPAIVGLLLLWISFVAA